MTDYPYSQQIHDKILNDWKNIPVEEYVYDYDFISHPSLDYKLWWNGGQLYHENIPSGLSKEHATKFNNQNT